MPADHDWACPSWGDFRRHMPVVARWAYFDHAAVAPLCGPAAKALRDWSQPAASDGDTQWNRWPGRAEETRGPAASLIGARFSRR
jgi:selenocysteine lyase/cysteine desulfurase